MVELLSSTKEHLKLIATAARVCYSGLPTRELLASSSEEDDRALVRRVVSMGHLSVVEHGVMSFKVGSDFKEELFEIQVDKPFLKISQKEDYFIVTVNFRTILELLKEKPHLKLGKEFRKFLPEYLKP